MVAYNSCYISWFDVNNSHALSYYCNSYCFSSKCRRYSSKRCFITQHIFDLWNFCFWYSHFYSWRKYIDSILTWLIFFYLDHRHCFSLQIGSTYWWYLKNWMNFFFLIFLLFNMFNWNKRKKLSSDMLFIHERCLRERNNKCVALEFFFSFNMTFWPFVLNGESYRFNHLVE